MATPSNPTVTDLVTEGIKQAGENNPSSSLLTRAGSEWMEEIKNDIWNLSKKPKVLHTTAYTILNTGQSRYAYPLDYSSDLSLTVLAGSHSGTCQGGTANTITLGTTDTSGAEIIGKEILMMSGTSRGSYSQIVSYDTTTKIAGMVPDWNITPIASDGYMFIDVEYPTETRPMFDYESRAKFMTPGLPQFLYPMGDENEGYFLLNCPPNTNYGARLRYYADITRVDTSSNLFSTCLRRWRNIFIEGIRMKKLRDEDDTRADAALRDYTNSLQSMIYRELYGMDVSNLNDRITDY